MDYERLFSEDTKSFYPSPVREIFKKVRLDQIFSFSGGYPSPETFPIEEIKKMSADVLERYGATALQYGGSQGVPPLLKALSQRYSVKEDNIQITTSSQQGIDVCTRILINPGDIILTTNPTYLGAIQSFKSYRAEIIALEGFKREDCGVSEETLSKAKFCYIIPDFQNPSGETISEEQRYDLVSLSKEFGFIIVEDSPYKELRLSGRHLTSIYELAPERTLHLGSFSKILAPGFRIGWIFGPQELLRQVYLCKQSLDLCPPVMDQYIVAEYIESGALDRILPKTIDYYRKKRDILLSLLEKYMPEGSTWTSPEGGLFLFLTLPQSCDTEAMYRDALNSKVAYVAGSLFYIDGSHRNTMRLSYSYISEEKMETGVRILAEVIRRNTAELFKYSGAGNDFVVLYESFENQRDNYRRVDVIRNLCNRRTGYKAADGKIGADGMMILSKSEKYDFKMEYFNSDGSSGMMCGNGGRCIVAFANQMGFRPADGKVYLFEAADGLHTGEILSDGNIRIKMIDAFGMREIYKGYFLNTGTRHFVRFVRDVESIKIEEEGPKYRWDEAFAPQGANVNFVTVRSGKQLKIRTFEKGVEAETLACGTGITAAAIATYYASIKASGIKPNKATADNETSTKNTAVCYSVEARKNSLKVEFIPASEGDIVARDVYLTGPVELII